MTLFPAQKQGSECMTVLRCRGITKAYGEHSVLRGIDFDLNSQEHVGLVGLNGAGKSTLANLICGQQLPDAGQVTTYQRNMRIGYLGQNATYTMYQNQMKLPFTERDHATYLEVASHLGLDDWQEDRMKALSGGERTKLAIAQAWSSKPDLLILDEPTNHLDFQGVEWLVYQLKTRQLTTIIISHDRYFLDQTVTRIAEISEGKLTNFVGNYTAYRKEKQLRYESQLHHYIEQKKVEEKIEQEITRLKEWSAKGHREAGKVGKMAEMRVGVKEFHRKKAKMMDKQVKSRIKRLEKIDVEGVQNPKEDAKVFFEWNQSLKRGKSVLLADQIAKFFDKQVLFQDSSFYVQRGEKVGIVGPNGCGKSTLLRIITGQIELDQGELWSSPNIKISNLEQDVKEMEPQIRVVDIVEANTKSKQEVAQWLSVMMNMGLSGTIVRKKLSELSHGEKTRVKLSQLVMEQQDILILDEPTNHLDLIYREQLEQALMDYEGTLLVVSHDRYFLEAICDKLLVFEHDRIQRKEYGFKDFMESSKTKSKQKQKQKSSHANVEEELLLMDHELTYTIGELSKYQPNTPEYIALDESYKQLLERKRELLKK